MNGWITRRWWNQSMYGNHLGIEDWVSDCHIYSIEVYDFITFFVWKIMTYVPLLLLFFLLVEAMIGTDVQHDRGGQDMNKNLTLGTDVQHDEGQDMNKNLTLFVWH